MFQKLDACGGGGQWANRTMGFISIPLMGLCVVCDLKEHVLIPAGLMADEETNQLKAHHRGTKPKISS